VKIGRMERIKKIRFDLAILVEPVSIKEIFLDG